MTWNREDQTVCKFCTFHPPSLFPSFSHSHFPFLLVSLSMSHSLFLSFSLPPPTVSSRYLSRHSLKKNLKEIWIFWFSLYWSTVAQRRWTHGSVLYSSSLSPSSHFLFYFILLLSFFLIVVCNFMFLFHPPLFFLAYFLVSFPSEQDSLGFNDVGQMSW